MSAPAGARVRITVNGRVVELAAGATLVDVVSEACASERGVAVALDRAVVPRSKWAFVVVPEGAAVEIVTAAAGG